MEKKDDILDSPQPQEDNEDEDDDDEGIKKQFKKRIHLEFKFLFWKILAKEITKCSLNLSIAAKYLNLIQAQSVSIPVVFVLDEMINEPESDAPSSETSSDEEEDEPEEEDEGWLLFPFYCHPLKYISNQQRSSWKVLLLHFFLL